FGAVTIDNCLTHAPLHFLGLAPQHRGLIRDADRLEMHVRIESRRICAAEFFEKRLLVAAVTNVITNVIGVGQSEHDQIMTFAVPKRARTGRLRFFVLGFPVNDGGGRFAGVFANAFPNAHHVATSRVHDLAAAFLDLLLNRQFGAERRYNNNVVRSELSNVCLLVWAGQVFDPERRYLLVDLGVMNDFADNKQATVLENFPGGVGQIDRPLDPVAKAEFLREADSRVTNANDSASAANFVDNVTAIMLLDLFLHRGHNVGRTQVDFLDKVRRAGGIVRVGDTTVRLAKEFGFCYGVERAIDLAYAARKVFKDRRLFIVGEIIHNPEVNQQIASLGIKNLTGPNKQADIA